MGFAQPQGPQRSREGLASLPLAVGPVLLTGWDRYAGLGPVLGLSHEADPGVWSSGTVGPNGLLGSGPAPLPSAGCPALLSRPAHTTQQALPRSAILILILSAFWGSRGFTRRFEAPNGAGEGREVGRD